MTERFCLLLPDMRSASFQDTGVNGHQGPDEIVPTFYTITGKDAMKGEPTDKKKTRRRKPAWDRFGNYFCDRVSMKVGMLQS